MKKGARTLSTFTMKHSYPSSKTTKPANDRRKKNSNIQVHTHKKRSKILLVVKLLHTCSFFTFDTHYLLTQNCRLMYKHSAIYCKLDETLHPYNEDQKIHMHILIPLPKCPKQAVIFWAY